MNSQSFTPCPFPEHRYGESSTADQQEPSVANQVFKDGDKEIAYYYPLPKNYSDKQVIFFENGKVLLRRFDEISLSAMTAIAYLDGKIKNLDSLYNTLSCLPANSNIARAYLPPGTITSVRWGDKNKGEKIGHFPHSVSISMWSGSKEQKCKITKKSEVTGDRDTDASKLQLTGINLETAKTVGDMIAYQLSEAGGYYKYISNNLKEFEQVIDYLVNMKHGEEIVTCEDGTFKPDRIINWAGDFPDKYQRLACETIKRLTDLRYVSEIIPRAIEILSRPEPCDSNMRVYSVRRAMAKYNYNLGFEINRLKLTKYLVKIGYPACFFNEIVDYVFVPTADDLLDNAGTVRREPGRDNQFEIFESGKINHSGTGSLPMESTYVYFLLDIIKGVDEFAIFPENRDMFSIF